MELILGEENDVDKKSLNEKLKNAIKLIEAMIRNKANESDQKQK
jgi:hypothetical protein